MAKIIRKDETEGQLMNEQFNVYYIQSRNQVLFSGKGDFKGKDFLISLDSIEVK
jgi:hypothetical protein